LLNRGLSAEQLRRGWELFSAALGFTLEAPVKIVRTVVSEAANAQKRLEAWDAPTYGSTLATLEYRTPLACGYLLRGLAGSEGPDAVIGVEHFLDRVAALRTGTAPGVSETESALAVRLLEERKIIGETIEAELRESIAQTKLGAEPVFPVRRELDAAAEAAFTEYRNWLNEWREIARATFTQRRHLIALGLATRRDREEQAEPAAVESAPVSVH
jgi:hypothetical protein